MFKVKGLMFKVAVAGAGNRPIVTGRLGGLAAITFWTIAQTLATDRLHCCFLRLVRVLIWFIAAGSLEEVNQAVKVFLVANGYAGCKSLSSIFGQTMP